jgi:hypothetical protein
MFRNLIAGLVLALIAATAPAHAAGALQQFTVQDGIGNHATYYLDLSGTGAGPWVPAIATIGSAGNVASSSVTHTQSSALASNLVVENAAGNLYSFEVSADSTLSGAAWWLMIYDATSAPADGAVTPAKCFAYPSGATGASYAFPTPVAFTTGITIAVSTTGCFTKTASAHAFIAGDFQ